MSSILGITRNEIPESIDVSRAHEPGVEIVCNIPRVVKMLVCIVMTLVIVGTFASIITFQVAPSPNHRLARLMHRFDLGFEPSIPNWYSSCALLASSILLAIIALAKVRTHDRFGKHWAFLAVLFLGLSIDEGVRIHEMIHTVLVKFIDSHGIFYYPWVVPALIFVAVVGATYLPFLKHVDRRTAVLFIVAGGIYVFGTVGMDMVGGVIVEKHGYESIQHTMGQTVEEMCEMMGIVVFLYALLDYIRRFVGPIRLSVV